VLAGELEEAAAHFGPEASRSVAASGERSQDAIDTVVMPTTEVIIAVAEKLECDHLPSPEKVSGWAAEALRVFDAEGGAGWDDAGERRRSIEETFARLSRVVGGQAEGRHQSQT